MVINQGTKIENPVLWSPETPYLYKMYTEIIGPDGQPVDHQVTTFGIRSVEMRGDGFYLNGKIYPIKGTANHQDHAGDQTTFVYPMFNKRYPLLYRVVCTFVLT